MTAPSSTVGIASISPATLSRRNLFACWRAAGGLRSLRAAVRRSAATFGPVFLRSSGPAFLSEITTGPRSRELYGDTAPDGLEQTCDLLVSLAAALRAQPELAESAEQTDRRFQITLQPKRILPEDRLWDLANQVICLEDRQDVTVRRSSHSIDILAPSVSEPECVAPHAGGSRGCSDFDDRRPRPLARE